MYITYDAPLNLLVGTVKFNDNDIYREFHYL